MAQELKPTPHPFFERLQADIERQKVTIASLKSGGHRCPDAELQLQLMREEFARRLSQSRN